MVRQNRGLFFAISALILALSIWGFSGQKELSGTPPAFQDDGRAYPIRIGEVEAGRAEELRLLIEGWPPDTELRIVEADATEHLVALPRAYTTGLLIVTFISGLFFWSIGTFVFAPRIQRPGARNFFWISLLYGLAIMIGGAYFPRDPSWWQTIPAILQWTCLAVLPVIFLHLSLVFPRRSPALDLGRRLMPLVWLAAAGVIFWQAFVFLRYIRDPGPAAGLALSFPQFMADGLLVAQFVAGCSILFWRSRHLQLTRERRQLKWLLWGFAVGAAPYVILRTLPELCGLAAPFPPHVDRVFEMAIPIAFVFAVVRYQFLDIDIIIRRSLIYGILAAGLMLVYVVVVVAIGRRLEGEGSHWAWIVLIVLGVLVGAAFNPLQRAIGDWVDRTFFKIEHNYAQALQSFRREAERELDQRELARTLTRFLTVAIQPQRPAVLLGDGDQLVIAGDVTVQQARAWQEFYEHEGPGAGKMLVAPGSSSLPEIEIPDFPDVFQREEVVIVEPICWEDTCLGLIMLGRRWTERRYIDPDISYVADCAGIAAVALERIRLHQAVTEEAMARKRLDELNRLKNDFLSRVAHDLRTPLASISWSTENLLDGVVGDLAGSQAEYLRSIKTSAAHLNRLVSNLLEISRLEKNGYQVELGRVDLVPVIEQAVLAVKPVAAERRIEFAVQIKEDAAPVRGNEDKLVEVAMNLLENAVKYSPPEGRVEITIGAAGLWQQSFTVRDQGPGLKEVDVAALFTRFEQGHPSPHSQQHGFGLGLYIVKSYLEIMSGEVEAENHPDGGAVFTCYLPEHTPTAEAEL